MKKFINIVLDNSIQCIEQFLRNKVNFYNHKRFAFHLLLLKQEKSNSLMYYIYRFVYRFFSNKLYFYVDCLLNFLEGK